MDKAILAEVLTTEPLTWRGRYVYDGGHPNDLLKTIIDEYARLDWGASRTLAYLTSQHWFRLAGTYFDVTPVDFTALLASDSLSRVFPTTAIGLGVKVLDVVHRNEIEWYTEADDIWWCDWLYLIHGTSIEVGIRDIGGWKSYIETTFGRIDGSTES